MEPSPHAGAWLGHGAGDSAEDPELAAAIEASFRTQAFGGAAASEDDQLAQALELSRLEEEARQRGNSGDTRTSPTNLADRSPVLPVAADREPRGQSSNHRMGMDISGELGSGSSIPVPMEQDDLDEGFVGEAGFPPRRQHQEDEVLQDSQLAMAIEASYASQTQAGMLASEEEQLQRALQMSKMEDDARARRALREQQEAELQESIMMDQMREQAERNRARELEEQQAREAAEAAEAARQRAAEQAAKRARVPDEPQPNEPGRVDFMIRAPDGSRIRRAFRSSNTVGQVYDFIDLQENLELSQKAYRIITTMPRKAFEDRSMTLEAANLQGQCALLIEVY